MNMKENLRKIMSELDILLENHNTAYAHELIYEDYVSDVLENLPWELRIVEYAVDGRKGWLPIASLRGQEFLVSNKVFETKCMALYEVVRAAVDIGFV